MVTVARAQYTPSALEELRGNPYAEALPRRLAPDEFVQALAVLPDFAEEQREWPAAERQMAARRLQSSVIPSRSFRRFYEDLHGMLVMGYASRNPREPRVVEWMYDVAQKRSPVERTTAETQLLTGLSGIGKTTMLKAILDCFPQVIVHESYEGKPFRQQQLVFIHVEIPPDASRKGLCLSIFDAVDEALDTDYSAQYRKPRTSVDEMQDGIRTICATHGVGVIAIDEFQNLNVAKAGGDQVLLQFFDTLSNRARVPIVKCGTPPALRVFGRVFRSARRAGTGGDLEMVRHSPDDPDWQHLVRIAWRYQWVKHPVELTDELAAHIHDLTQGLPSMLFRLLQFANQEAIATGRETIDESLLDQVYARHFRLLRHALSALKLGEVGLYEDLMTANQFFESRDGRSRLKQLLDLARQTGMTGDAARAVAAYTKDALKEYDLNPAERKTLEALKKDLQGKGSLQRPPKDGDDHGDAAAV